MDRLKHFLSEVNTQGYLEIKVDQSFTMNLTTVCLEACVTLKPYLGSLILTRVISLINVGLKVYKMTSNTLPCQTHNITIIINSYPAKLIY